MKLISKHWSNDNERYKWEKYIEEIIEVSLIHSSLVNNKCHLAARVSCTIFEINYLGSYLKFQTQLIQIFPKWRMVRWSSRDPNSSKHLGKEK